MDHFPGFHFNIFGGVGRSQPNCHDCGMLLWTSFFCLFNSLSSRLEDIAIHDPFVFELESWPRVAPCQDQDEMVDPFVLTFISKGKKFCCGMFYSCTVER